MPLRSPLQVHESPESGPGGRVRQIRTPLEPMDRLAALIPPPRRLRHRDDSVRVPHAPQRKAVTARVVAPTKPARVEAGAVAEETPVSRAVRDAWAIRLSSSTTTKRPGRPCSIWASRSCCPNWPRRAARCCGRQPGRAAPTRWRSRYPSSNSISGSRGRRDLPKPPDGKIPDGGPQTARQPAFGGHLVGKYRGLCGVQGKISGNSRFPGFPVSRLTMGCKSRDTLEMAVEFPILKIIRLPRGATPVDLAYAVHTDIGPGFRIAGVVARRLLAREDVAAANDKRPASLVIRGTEGMAGQVCAVLPADSGRPDHRIDLERQGTAHPHQRSPGHPPDSSGETCQVD